MTHTYRIIKPFVDDRRFAWLSNQPTSIERPWRLTEGVPIGTDLPPDTEFPMDPDYGDMLTDFVLNTINVLIVSNKVRAIFKNEAVANIEYLPIVILDKKGRVKSEDFSVANLLGSVDCLDAENSVYEDDPLAEGQITNVQRLNILIEKVAKDIKLFRLKQKHTCFIIRDDLLKSLHDHGVTGLETFDMNTQAFFICL